MTRAPKKTSTRTTKKTSSVAAKKVSVKSVKEELKLALERADLLEARARIAIAHTEISRSQLERQKIANELNKLKK